jgi:hypothetical protein
LQTSQTDHPSNTASFQSPLISRCHVRNFAFNDFRLDARLRYHHDQGTIKAHANGKRLSVWLRPSPPYSGITLVIRHDDDVGYVTRFRVKKSTNVFPHKAIAIVRCDASQPHPQLAGKLRWQAPPLSITDVKSDLSLYRKAYRARAAWNYSRTGVRLGASVRFSRLDMDFGALWAESRLRIAGEFVIGALWRAGFRVFPRYPSHTAVGAKRMSKWGDVKGAINFEKATVSAKIKK